MKNPLFSWLNEKPGPAGLLKSSVIALFLVSSFILFQGINNGLINWQGSGAILRHLDSSLSWISVFLFLVVIVVLTALLKAYDVLSRDEFYSLSNRHEHDAKKSIVDDHEIVPVYKQHRNEEERYSLDFFVSSTPDLNEPLLRQYLPRTVHKRQLYYTFVPPVPMSEKEYFAHELKKADILLLITSKNLYWEKIAGGYYSALQLDMPIMLLAEEGAVLPENEKHFPPKTPASNISHFSSLDDLSREIQNYVNGEWSQPKDIKNKK